MSTTALRPGFFNTLSTIKKDEKVIGASISNDERHLHALSSHAGWQIIDSYTRSLLDDLDNMTEVSMAQGLSLEEIGRNALVANLAKGVIKHILQKVEDAKEAVDKPDGTVR